MNSRVRDPILLGVGSWGINDKLIGLLIVCSSSPHLNGIVAVTQLN